MEYIAFIPLIGGMAIANEQATGKKPKYVLSYKAFEKNESNLKAYWPDVEWKLLDAETNTLEDEPDYSDIDFVSSVCPCAGMSQMSMNSSPDSETNNWLYKAADYILGKIRPKVYFGENAPGLYSDNNIKVANKLREFADKYGYAFTIYKTDTRLHGIPQRRVRTFFFFWKGDKCPVMEYYNHPSDKPFEEWILDKNVGIHSDTISKINLERVYPEFKWVLETKCNNNYAEYVKFIYDFYDNGHRIPCVSGYAYDSVNRNDYIQWLNDSGNGDITLAENGKKTAMDVVNYRINKIDNGMRYYSDEPVIYKEYASALTGKNLFLILHPKEYRVLTIRECMSLMGLPNDFEVTSKNFVHITQNVPVCTAKDMTEQVMKFCNNQLTLSDFKYIKQNNLTGKIDYHE